MRVGNEPNPVATRIAGPVTYTHFSHTLQESNGSVAQVTVRSVNVAWIGPFSNRVAAVARQSIPHNEFWTLRSGAVGRDDDAPGFVAEDTTRARNC